MVLPNKIGNPGRYQLNQDDTNTLKSGRGWYSEILSAENKGQAEVIKMMRDGRAAQIMKFNAENTPRQ